MRAMLATLAGGAFIAAIIPAVGQPVAQAEGHAIAVKVCRQCHDVERGPVDAKSQGTPSFAAIAAMPSTTALSLKVFLRSPHANMPDIILSDTEINAVSDYILSLSAR